MRTYTYIKLQKYKKYIYTHKATSAGGGIEGSDGFVLGLRLSVPIIVSISCTTGGGSSSFLLDVL